MNRTTIFLMAAMVFFAFFSGCASIKNKEFKESSRQTNYDRMPFL